MAHGIERKILSERRITEKEYWAQRRGQEKLDKLNQKIERTDQCCQRKRNTEQPYCQ